MTTKTDLRWIAWVRQSAQPPWLDTIDAMLDNPGGYGARFHLSARGVGNYAGDAGKALCGCAIPEDDPDEILLWADTVTAPGIPYCKRCQKAQKRRQ